MKTKLLLPAIVTLSGLAHASVLVTEANLDGPSESPPNASPGTGFAQVTYDSVAHTLALDVTFSGLLGTTTASHIHAATAVAGSGTAGVATQLPFFTGFPIGVTSGSYSQTFDLTDTASFNSSFVTANGGTAAGAEAALAAALNEGKAYLNIHSSLFAGGEIRGFLVPVPEPGTYALIAGLGLCGFGVWRRVTRA